MCTRALFLSRALSQLSRQERPLSLCLSVSLLCLSLSLSLSLILSSSTRWSSSSICFFRSSILDPSRSMCSSSCFKSSCAREARARMGHMEARSHESHGGNGAWETRLMWHVSHGGKVAWETPCHMLSSIVIMSSDDIIIMTR